MSTVLLEQEQNTAPVSAGEDDVRQYLQEIRRYPRLTEQEEQALASHCAAGDEDAIRTMVNSNLRLVVSVARAYGGRGVPLLDMIQEGSIGLLTAARKFDPALQCRFSTYATKWIRQGVTRCILNHAGLIRVPRHTAEKMRKLLASRFALEQALGTPPTDAQLAEHSGMPEKKVKELLALLPEVCSLDAPVGETGEGALQWLLEDETTPQPQQALVRQELQQTMSRLLSMLTERQQQVLQLRFGMADGQCHSLEEIGKLLGISKERARQIEHQATARLQKLGAELGLEDFLE